MSLLLLFNSSNPPPSASEPYVQVLLEKATGIFADVSTDLRSGYTNRGRQRELDRYQAGTCSLELANALRTYDSAIDLDIKPGKRLQVLASYGGTTWPQFTGKVDGWTERSNGPNDAVAIVEATDAFKDLAKADLPSSAYALEVAADAPVAWWRLGEPTGADTAYDTVGAKDLVIVGVPVFGGDSLVTREPDTAVQFPAVTDGAYHDAPVVGGGPFTVDFVFRYEGAGTGSIVSQKTRDGLMYGFEVEILSGGNVDFNVFVAGATSAVGTTGVNVTDGLVHHVAVVWQVGGLLKVYVDGADVTDAVVSTANAAFLGNGTFVVNAGPLGGQVISGMKSAYDEVAVYDTALSAARVAAHAAARATPWNGDTPGQRVGRILDHVGTPAALRDLDPGSSVLQSATLATSALEAAQKVAESEFGPLYVRADGTIVLEDRHSNLNEASQATFSDQPGAALVYKDSTPRYDDGLIRNDVTVSRAEGVAQRAEDAASIAEFGRYSFTLDGLLHDDDDMSRDAANFILSEYKTPARRITDLTVGPVPAGKEAAMYPQMLGRELTEKITVTEHPQSIDPVLSQASVIEGISQSFGPKHWQTKWQLSPALAGAFWQIGVAGFSELGTTTRLGF